MCHVLYNVSWLYFPPHPPPAVKSAKVRGRKRKRVCDENGEGSEVVAGGEEQVGELLTQLIMVHVQPLTIVLHRCALEKNSEFESTFL